MSSSTAQATSSAVLSPIELIRREALLISCESLIAAEQHYAAETPYYVSVFWMALVPIVLSVATALLAVFQPDKSTIKFIASLSAVATGLTAKLRFATTADTHHKYAKKYEVLYNQAGRFARLDCSANMKDAAALRISLDKLAESQRAIKIGSPSLSGGAQKRGRNNVCTNRGEVIRIAEDECGDATL